MRTEEEAGQSVGLPQSVEVGLLVEGEPLDGPDELALEIRDLGVGLEQRRVVRIGRILRAMR